MVYFLYKSNLIPKQKNEEDILRNDVKRENDIVNDIE